VSGGRWWLAGLACAVVLGAGGYVLGTSSAAARAAREVRALEQAVDSLTTKERAARRASLAAAAAFDSADARADSALVAYETALAKANARAARVVRSASREGGDVDVVRLSGGTENRSGLASSAPAPGDTAPPVLVAPPNAQPNAPAVPDAAPVLQLVRASRDACRVALTACEARAVLSEARADSVSTFAARRLEAHAAAEARGRTLRRAERLGWAVLVVVAFTQRGKA